MMKSLKLTDYYKSLQIMNTKELCIYGLQAIGLICLFGYFFYRSIAITIMGLPFSFVFLVFKSKEIEQKKRLEIETQFKEVLVSVNSSLRAGYSLENSFMEAKKDMEMFYGKKTPIVKELEIMKKGLCNGKTLVVSIAEMGKRCDVGLIKDLASILVIGKQTGGNLSQIIDSFISVAEDKVLVEQEIETIISSQKYEQKVMNAIPFFIIFYIETTSRGFFDVLYNNILGRIIMSICLILYLVSVYWSGRIAQIKV